MLIHRRGDITKLGIDVIVNAANKSLMGGGGVDGAIHSAAGPSLGEECRRLMGCAAGDAKMTGGHNLPAKSPSTPTLSLTKLEIIHTVGPIYFSDETAAPRLLASCYRKSLDLAKQHNLKSIAFPSLSTGIYGYTRNIRD
jgi:O-acetyl-ADP-ribose deacetylase (regulator of RNase III)